MTLTPAWLDELRARTTLSAVIAPTVKLIKAGNRKGIDEAITDAKVEKKVLERLRMKADLYGTDPNLNPRGGCYTDQSWIPARSTIQASKANNRRQAAAPAHGTHLGAA